MSASLNIPFFAKIASVGTCRASLICDPGERYLDKYYSDQWLDDQGLDIEPYQRRLEDFIRTGTLP